MTKKNICLCGQKLRAGEKEVEIIKGDYMVIPVWFCDDPGCEHEYHIDFEVMAKAEELVKAGVTKYS